MEWHPAALPEGPPSGGSGNGGDAGPRLWIPRRQHPLRGRIFLRKALLNLSWAHHSASGRLALHPKNRTPYPVQLPDLARNIVPITEAWFKLLKLP